MHIKFVSVVFSYICGVKYMKGSGSSYISILLEWPHWSMLLNWKENPSRVFILSSLNEYWLHNKAHPLFFNMLTSCCMYVCTVFLIVLELYNILNLIKYIEISDALGWYYSMHHQWLASNYWGNPNSLWYLVFAYFFNSNNNIWLKFGVNDSVI